MSTQQPDDSTHPLNMDPAALKASLEELDAEENGTGEPEVVTDPAAGVPDPAADPEGSPPAEGDPVVDPAADPAKTADPAKAAKAADPAPADEDDAKPVDRKAFNGVLNELRETREKLKLVEAKQGAFVAPEGEPRDFKAEREALKERWDNADLDTDEYNNARDTLVLEEAEYRATARFHALQAQSQVQAAKNSWDESVGAWEAANAEFMANPIRRKAVADLIVQLDTDPDNKLDDAALLAKVQETAFEAFNWTGKPATVPDVPVDTRMSAAARAAAAASAAPPAFAGGVGTGAVASKVDLEAAMTNPSKFAGAKQAVTDVLGEEA